MFKYAIHNRLIAFNPCAGVCLPKTKTKEIRVLTLEEQKEVVAHARGRLYENLILVALGTGMRGGEMLGLTWDDVDFRRREISINKTLVHIKDPQTGVYTFKYQTPKTKNGIRKIPMQESVYKALKKQHVQLKEMQRVAKETGTPFTPIPHFYPHALRHTFATRCFEAGIDAKVVQGYLGHFSISITLDLYTHVTNDKAKTEMNKLEDLYEAII